MTHMTHMREIHKADPAARRQAVLILLAALAYGSLMVLGISYLEGPIQYWLEANVELLVEYPVLVFLFGVVLVAPLLVGGVFLLRYSSLIVKSERIPPPGARVARDTVVVTGPKARLRGRIAQALCLFLLFAAGIIPFFLAYLFLLLGQVPA